MFANYHTHTYRCGHATGTEEEYIQNAIKGGIKILGFSDHAPFVFPDGHEDGWRMKMKDAENYIDTLCALREKYKDKIKIHIGFEMEYYPKYYNEMFSIVKGLGAEYLILGQHFIANQSSLQASSTANGHTDEQLCEYVDLLIEAMQTNKFLYIAHPDIFLFEKNSNTYNKQMSRLCQEAKKTNTPLEINFLGIFDNRHYPNETFLEIAGKVGNKVIFGMDSHSTERAFDTCSLEKAKKLVAKYKLNLIDSVEIKGI